MVGWMDDLVMILVAIHSLVTVGVMDMAMSVARTVQLSNIKPI